MSENAKNTIYLELFDKDVIVIHSLMKDRFKVNLSVVGK